jgi:hypothetical protein
MSSPTPGPIPLASATQQGQVSITQQQFGGLKLYLDGVAPLGDIRNYGAVAVPANTVTTATQSSSDAIDAALAAADPILAAAEVSFIGTYMIERPIVLPGAVQANIHFHGYGYHISQLIVGYGDSLTPDVVQGFSGPAIMSPVLVGQNTHPVIFGAPLVSTGRSLTLDAGTGYWLHDSYGWMWAVNQLSALALELWLQPTDLGPNNTTCGIIGSAGPGNISVVPGVQDSAWGMTAAPSGSDYTVTAFLTTQGSGKQTITTAPLAFNVNHHLELDYNGAFFDFYLDGVNIGHLAATGVVYRQPWEGVSIGCQGFEGNLNPIQGIQGLIDSIRFSQIARHTGTGSFTPPTTRYAWDTDTLGLINNDQPAPAGLCVNAPFLMGQVATGTGGWVKHYIRYTEAAVGEPWGGYGAQQEIEQFIVSCHGITSGIVYYQSAFSYVRNVYFFGAAQYAILSWDPGSFYNTFADCYAFDGYGIGYFLTCLTADRMITTNQRIGQWYTTGIITGASDQPGGSSIGPPFWQNMSSFYPFIVGGSIEGFNSYIQMNGCSIDAESLFPTMRAGVLVLEPLESATFQQNIWNTLGGSFNVFGTNGAGPGAPCFYYDTIPPNGATHIGDLFNPSTVNPYATLTKGPQAVGFITLKDSYDQGLTDFPTPVPLTDIPGWIVIETPTSRTNQTGLSTSDLQANNMLVTFQIRGGTTSTRYNFFTPEPDGDFDLFFSCIGSTGGSPASGSTNISGFVTEDDGSGFTATSQVDPGGSVINTYVAFLVRAPPPPLINIPSPTVSSIANPLTTVSPTGDFAFAITLEPVNGTNIPLNLSSGSESVVLWGAPSTNYMNISLVNSGQLMINYNIGIGFTGLPVDSFVYNGKLFGLMNPGSHNVINAKISGFWTPQMDGGVLPSPIPAGGFTGTQQTPVYLLQDAGGMHQLTSVDVADFKADVLVSRVATSESSYGPGNQAQSAIFGDSFAIGFSSTSADGGWASQVQAARYGTTYYWMAAQTAGRAAWSVAITNPVAFQGCPFWSFWGGFQTANLTTAAIMLGYFDILYDGASAADTWAALEQILSGTSAYIFYVPPSTSTATLVINGVSFVCTFSVNVETTINNLAATINASSPTNTLVKCSFDTVTGNRMRIAAVTPGAGGDGIVCSTNGANGATMEDLAATPVLSGSTTSGGIGAFPTITNVVLANVPPFGNSSRYSAGKETQRLALNVLIGNFCSANPSCVLADADATLRDSSNHTNINPTYLAGDNETLTDAGQTALFGLMNPLLP